MSSPISLLWSSAQARVATRLLEYAELFLFGDWTRLPGSFRPRLTPLVIGASGLGKTHVIREGVAKELGVAYMRLHSAGWVIEGAKTDPTMLRIQEFVSTHDQGIIHIDEIDKFTLGGGGGSGGYGGGSEWSKYLMGELLELLDRNPSHPVKNMEWSEEVLKKLKHDFWIVATGTWQDLWTQAAKAKVGFAAPQSEEALLENVRRLVATSDIIPPEILRRFNQEYLLMGPPTERDFRNAAESNGIIRLALALNEELDFGKAAQSGLGARWIEETLGRLLLKARRENRLDLVPLRPLEDGASIEADDDERHDGGPGEPKFGLERSVL